MSKRYLFFHIPRLPYGSKQTKSGGLPTIGLENRKRASAYLQFLNTGRKARDGKLSLISPTHLLHEYS
jgi:hypothetical protein